MNKYLLHMIDSFFYVYNTFVARLVLYQIYLFAAKLAKAAAQPKPPQDTSERSARAGPSGDASHHHVEINPKPEIIHRKESLDDVSKAEVVVKTKVSDFYMY